MASYRKHSTPTRPITANPAQQAHTLNYPGLRGRYNLSAAMVQTSHENVEEQTIDQEYNSFIRAPLSHAGTDIVRFWEVSSRH
jgi:hypothetical protein